MPLIPYPDVPMASGVPAVPRLSASEATAVINENKLTAPLPPLLTQWGFVMESGEIPIVPDSFIDFEYREEHKIPNYPVEDGGFASYNKVALPFDVRVTVSCNGNGTMTKEDFLTAIESLINSLTLLNVITPNKIYTNCNLIHVDYRREAKQGVSLIIAKLYFQEVRITQASVVTTSEPSGTPTQNNGQVSPVSPTAKQQTQANNTKIDFAFLTKILNR